MFRDDLKLALATARSEAHRLRHDHVRSEHLALGILRSESPALTRVLHGFDPTQMAAELEATLAPDRRTPDDPFDLPYAPGAKAVIERAILEAHALGTDQVGCEHLLVGVLRGKEAVARAPFIARGVDAARVHSLLVGPPD